MNTNETPLYTMTPISPGPNFGFKASNAGNLIIDLASATQLTLDTQLAIVLSAIAGAPFVEGRDAFRHMLAKVEHLIDHTNGGIMPEFRGDYTSPEIIAAANRHRTRINEAKVISKCTAVFVGGLPIDCTAADIASIFDRWNVQHIHLGHSQGRFAGWAKAYLSSIDAGQAIEYYESHEASINKRPVRVAKATRRADAVVAPSQPEEAK